MGTIAAVMNIDTSGIVILEELQKNLASHSLQVCIAQA